MNSGVMQLIFQILLVAKFSYAKIAYASLTPNTNFSTSLGIDCSTQVLGPETSGSETVILNSEISLFLNLWFSVNSLKS